MAQKSIGGHTEVPTSTAIIGYKRQFAEDLGAVERDLDTFHTGMDRRQGNLSAEIQQFARSLTSAVRHRNLAPELEAAFDDCVGALDAAAGQWAGKAKDVADGQEFINQFEKSLVVMVFGMVNCGKSSLGNYLAKCVCDVSGHDIPLDTFFYDKDGKKKALHASPVAPTGYPFEVRETECTARIQGYTVGGLTWIDTPGVGTMNDLNHALAQQYAAHSELVIFLTSSDSPLRAKELALAMQLVGAGKSILIVVSKFDRNHDVWRLNDDGNDVLIGRVPKPKDEKSRREQRDWIQAQIAEARLEVALKDSSVCFVTTACAVNAERAGATVEFDSSGMPDLFRQLGKVLRHGPQAMKTDAPRKRFNAFVTDLVAGKNQTSIPVLQQKIDGISEKLTDIKRKYEGKTTGLANGLQGKVTTQVARAFGIAEQKLASSVRDDEAITASLESELNKCINEALRSELQAEFAAFALTVDASIVHGLAGFAAGVGQLEKVRRFEERTTKERAGGYGAAIGALLGGLACMFIPFGQGAGAWLLGVAAGAVAAAAGGAAGKAVGENFAGKELLTVDGGTNVAERQAQFLKALPGALEPLVREAIAKVTSAYLQPRIDHLAKISKACEDLKGKLRNSMYERR